MKKWNFKKKGTWAALVTGFLIMSASIAVLANSTRLSRVFDPDDYRRFDNWEDFEPDYDSVAGDGEKSDLATRDEDGEDQAEDSGQDIRTKDNLLDQPEDDEVSGEEDVMGLALGRDDTDGTEDTGANPNAYELTDQGGVGTLGTNPSQGSGAGFGTDTDGEGSSIGGNGSGGGTLAPAATPGATSAPAQRPATPAPSSTPKPSWEQQQLSPDAPVMTKDGELVALRVSVPRDWTFFRGESYNDEGVTVEAAVRNSGKTSYLPLAYGGDDGYSVTMSTASVGSRTAVFSYLGVTARRNFKVLSSRVSVRYLLKDNYVAEFPGPLGGSEAELAALRGLDTYPGKDGYADLRRHHSYMIAFLGDEDIRAEFMKDRTYATAMFLETDEDGYLTNMLTGYRYVLQRVFQDEAPYIYYPVTNWGDYTGRSVADVVEEVPAGYRLRRETTGRDSLTGYMGEQVLVGYDGQDETLKVPDGTTKIAIEDGSPNGGVTSMIIPESVESVDAASVAKAFPGLQRYEITGHSAFRVVGSALYSGDGTTLLSLPPGAAQPDEWSPELAAIGAGALYGNSIEELVLPGGIGHLAEGCFAGFLGQSIRIGGASVPAIEGDPGFRGELLVADSEYDLLCREWMFALGESANRLTIGVTDASGEEIESKRGLYRYDAENRVLAQSGDERCLAAVPAGFRGRFPVPESYTSVGEAAFAGCESLSEIEFPGDVTLKAGSLILPGSVQTVVLQGSGVQIDAHAFGNAVGNVTVYVPGGTYDSYLTEWTETLDPVYGAGTAARILKPWDDSIFVENNARYKRLAADGSEQFALLGVYGGSRKFFQVKEGTAEIADGAFAGCSELEIVCLPGSLVRVGRDVFAGCTSLQTIADGSAASLFAGEAAAEVPEDARVCSLKETYEGFLCEDDGAVYGRLAGGELALLDVPTDVEGVFALRENTVILEDNALRDCGAVTAVALEDGAPLEKIGESCFENCTALAGSLDLGGCRELATIGKNAFRGCASLEEISLPGKVAELKRGVFSGCSSLTGAEWENVQSIAKESFFECSDLREVNLSEVAAVGDRAFFGCTSLRELGSCGKLEKLGVRSFMGCSALTAVKLPKTLKTMDEECFRDCSALSTVSLKGKVTAISRYCFFGCQSLEKVTFSKRQKKALQVIGVQAFAQCGSLTSMDLRGLTALQQIGSQAFGNCGSLSIVILPKNLKSLPDYCFTDCGSLSILTLLADDPPLLGKGVFGEEIPPFLHLWVNDGKVKTYRKAYQKKLDKTYGKGTAKRILGVLDESKEIIGGITYIRNKAGERVLKEADANYEGSCQVLADTVRIADEAFKGCTKLTEIELPAGSFIQLGDRCFAGCTALENVRLSGSIPAWGEDTFRDCKGLKDLRIGESEDEKITRIGTRAFMGCTGLVGTASVAIETPVLTFGEGCFADCSELAGIAWSAAARDAVQVFEDRVFENCSAMKVSINSNFKGLESIGAYAFADCDSLENPSVPAAVTTLGEGCFADCDNLMTVSIYGAVEEYPAYCFRNCAKMTRTGGTAAAFAGLKRIGEGAYEGCASLNSSTETTWYLARYENLEEIGDHAFRGCTGLTRDVSFAAGLKKIGAGAFDGCSGLAEITLTSETPPQIGLFAPDTMAEGFTLRVPDSQADGDRVYLAYRESLAALLGSDRADAILDSASDGARERNTGNASGNDSSEERDPENGNPEKETGESAGGNTGDTENTGNTERE